MFSNNIVPRIPRKLFIYFDNEILLKRTEKQHASLPVHRQCTKGGQESTEST